MGSTDRHGRSISPPARGATLRRLVILALGAFAFAGNDSPSRVAASSGGSGGVGQTVTDCGPSGAGATALDWLREREPSVLDSAVESVPIDPASLPDVKSSAPNPPGVVSGSSLGGRDAAVVPALGFVGGRFTPAGGADPELLALGEREPAASHYAFLLLKGARLTATLLESAEALGVRFLGPHAPGAYKIAIPGAAVAPFASHPEVHWIGFARDGQNVDPALDDAIRRRGQDGRKLRIAVSLFENDPLAILEPVAPPVAAARESTPAGDSDPGSPVGVEPVLPRGPWLSTLESLGFEAVRLEPGLATLLGQAPAESIAAIAALPFVLYVEKMSLPRLAHDATMPLAGLDLARAIAGGADVPVGIIDSGYAAAHADLAAYTVAWDLTGEDDPFRDDCLHGSHVAGTFVGRGASDPRYRGGAPGAALRPDRRLFAAKIFSKSGSACVAAGDTLFSLSLMGVPYTDSNGAASPYPEILNGSWGVTGSGFVGTDTLTRAVDGMVFSLDQCAVFAAGNEGPAPESIRTPAVGKNVIAVGSVVDTEAFGPGSVGRAWTSSSRGFTGDGRVKPDVAAPGRMVRSVLAGTPGSYADMSGTSMAAPHVAAALASAFDEHAHLRRDPSRARAFLLSQAMLREDDPAHDWKSYGFGRVDAYRLHREIAGATGWRSGSAHGEVRDSSAAAFDIDVPVGTARVVLVLAWDEPAASAGADRAVLYDLDLALDAAPFDGAADAGEFRSASTISNTEFLILDSPPAGPARVKVFPFQVPPGAGVHFDVAWALHAGRTKPGGALVSSTDAATVRAAQPFRVTARAECDGSVAQAVVIEVSGDVSVRSSEVVLKDGAFVQSEPAANPLVLGAIPAGDAREARFTLLPTRTDRVRVVVRARSENWGTRETVLEIPGEGANPSLPTGIWSPTHAPFVWTRDDDVTLYWIPPSEVGAGLAGYGFTMSFSPATVPSAVPTIGPVTETTARDLASSASAYWAHLRPVDTAGRSPNDAAHFGPILIDAAPPSPGTLVIDGGDAYTSRLLVDLELSGAEDAQSGLAAGSMRFSNDDAHWSDWMPFAPRLEGFDMSAYSAGAGEGTRSVFAQVRDLAGNVSATALDTIVYRPDEIRLLAPGPDFVAGEPPTFRWTEGPCDIFAVQLSADGFETILVESWSDFGVRIRSPRWTLPETAWEALPRGVPIEWRVKGTRRDDPTRPRPIWTSVETGRFTR